jgi:hypothetical protein
MEAAGITNIIHGPGTAADLVSSLSQFSWFHQFQPLPMGLAYVPNGNNDQLVMGMVSTPSGVAAIFPLFNNPAVEAFMDDFISDAMSLEPRWSLGFCTAGASMSTDLASFLAQPRLVHLAPHLGPRRQTLPDAVTQQMIADGWREMDSGLLRAVIPTSDGRTQLVFVNPTPGGVVAMSPVGEPYPQLPSWATNQDWGTRGWEIIDNRLYMTQQLDSGPSCTIDYLRQTLGDLARHADNIESQLSSEDVF